MFVTTKLIKFNLLFKYNQIKLCSNRLFANKATQIKHNCIVSTIGSQSSGKTTFTEALKKTSAELNLKSDPTISSGTNNAVFDRYYVNNNETEIVHIDTDSMPPKNLITGSFGTDIGLLVIDSSKGLDDEAKEHILVLAFHGVKNFIVYINKLDLNTDDQLRELMIDEIKEFFNQQNLNLSNDSIICGSALKVVKSADNQDKQSILDVLKLIGEMSKNIDRDEQLKKPALFSIKRSHSKLNKGTEVTGFMRQGVLKKGDIVNICGYDRLFKTKIVEIESFKEQLDYVQPGISAALLLKSIKRDDIKRGMAIYHPDNNQFEITDHFKAKVHSFDSNQQPYATLTDDMTLQIFARTFDIRSIIEIENESKQLLPGQTSTIKFKLIKTMPLEKGMKFLIRTNKHVGFGEITELLQPFEIEFLNKAKKKSIKK